jgi:hypothetical protein
VPSGKLFAGNRWTLMDLREADATDGPLAKMSIGLEDFDAMT